MPTHVTRELRRQFHALDPKERTEWLHKLAQGQDPKG